MTEKFTAEAVRPIIAAILMRADDQIIQLGYKNSSLEVFEDAKRFINEVLDGKRDGEYGFDRLNEIIHNFPLRMLCRDEIYVTVFYAMVSIRSIMLEVV